MAADIPPGFREKRMAELKEVIAKEKDPEQKKNLDAVYTAYLNKELPPPEGIYHFTFWKGGKQCSRQETRDDAPYHGEVSITVVVVLSLFAK